MKKYSFAKKLFAASLAAVMTVGASALSVSAANEMTINTQIESVLPLNGSGAELKLNQTYELPEYISSRTGNTYTVTVSDSNVLKYKDGKITAVGTGTGTVNIVTKKGKKMSFTFNVKAPETEISIDQSKLILNKGQLAKINAKLKNSTGKIIWRSSNEKVVSVDQNGKLKAYNKGTAIISAETEKGETASCQVTVEDPIPVTAVNIHTHFINLTAGNSYQLKTSVSPADAADQTLKCSSLDTSVAAVSEDATVTAKAPGSTKIVVKSGNGVYSECQVIVTAPPVVPVEKVSVDKSEITLKAGKSMQIRASVSPSNAMDKSLKYTIGNPKVAKVSSSGNVTAKRAGRTKLTITSANGKKTVCIVNVTE